MNTITWEFLDLVKQQAYLGHCPTSIMEYFCESSQELVIFNTDQDWLDFSKIPESSIAQLKVSKKFSILSVFFKKISYSSRVVTLVQFQRAREESRHLILMNTCQIIQSHVFALPIQLQFNSFLFFGCSLRVFSLT